MKNSSVLSKPLETILVSRRLSHSYVFPSKEATTFLERYFLTRRKDVYDVSVIRTVVGVSVQYNNGFANDSVMCQFVTESLEEGYFSISPRIRDLLSDTVIDIRTDCNDFGRFKPLAEALCEQSQSLARVVRLATNARDSAFESSSDLEHALKSSIV